MLETLEWRDRLLQTHVGQRSLPSTVIRHPDGDEFVVYSVADLFPDAAHWRRPLSEISGFAWHHDAVAFSGGDADFDGHRSDEELERIAAVYRYHLNAHGERPNEASWNGIGYHCMGALEERLYVPKMQVLWTHRAHVAGGPGRGRGPLWNRQLLGFCHLGNYADRRAPDGKAVGPLDDRPPVVALKGADAWMRVVTDLLGRELTLRPHKFYQDKACPGTWTAKDSWADFRFEPSPPPSPRPPVEPSRAAAGGRDVGEGAGGRPASRGADIAGAIALIEEARRAQETADLALSVALGKLRR